MELVSVVVIAYNSQKTIVETLDSIFNQDYKRIELIVSDDFSKDRTCDTVRKWLKKHGNRFESVRVLRARKNHGVTMNCNIAIKAARGKYIQEMAADDIILSNCISTKIEYAKKQDRNVVFSKIRLVGPESPNKKKMAKYLNQFYDFCDMNLTEQKRCIAVRNYYVAPCGAFYNREWFISNGMYDVRYKSMEDYPWIYHYLMNDGRIELLDCELLEYRVTYSSLSQSGGGSRMNNDLFRFLLFERMWKLIETQQYRECYEQIMTYVKGWHG